MERSERIKGLRLELEEHLKNNTHTLLELAKELDFYMGGYDDLRTERIEELAECMNAYDLARAIIYGDVEGIDDDVRFNGYGNLESVSSYTLEDEALGQIDYIIDDVLEYNLNIDINDDVVQVLVNEINMIDQFDDEEYAEYDQEMEKAVA